MSNVITADFVTKLDMPAERVLREAMQEEIESAIVIGRDKDGDLYFASSIADGSDVLWLMEIAKRELLAG